jgi:hypothetical protein
MWRPSRSQSLLLLCDGDGVDLIGGGYGDGKVAGLRRGGEYGPVALS